MFTLKSRTDPDFLERVPGKHAPEIVLAGHRCLADNIHVPPGSHTVSLRAKFRRLAGHFWPADQGLRNPGLW